MATNTALSKAEQNALAVSYDVFGTHVELDLEFVKNYLVRGRADLVSDQEVVFFMNLCKMQNLNPLTGGEVYLIKYSKDQPAQNVVGKTTYMRRLYEHPDYLCKEDGITVKSGDSFVQKEGCCVYPGEELIGGWCRIHFIRNDKERTAFKEVSLSEYSSGMANWKTKPATMVNKVAVSQCAREAFPKDYEGMYSEEEMVASGAIPTSYVDVDEEGNVVEVVDNNKITQEQRQEFMNKISDNFQGKDAKNEAYTKILAELGMNSMNNMTVGVWQKAMELVTKYAEENSEEKVVEQTEEPEKKDVDSGVK
jgi:phage recombination protein Bet